MVSSIFAFGGRVLLSLIFIVAGVSKLVNLGTTERLIQSANLPAGLAIPTALFEIVGGLMILVGFMTRIMAIAFFAFSILTIAFFHNQFGDPVQMQMALKNLAIAGGFLLLFAYGNVAYGLDVIRARRREERVRLSAEAKQREAEIAAARAEGRIEGVREAGAHGVPGRL